jgi:hypothetical protein
MSKPEKPELGKVVSMDEVKARKAEKEAEEPTCQILRRTSCRPIS